MSSKTKKTSPKESSKGCVGYIKDGIIKGGNIVVCKSDSEDPKDLFNEYKNIYGTSIMLKYVVCENSSEKFDKFKDKIKSSIYCSNIYLGFSSTIDKELESICDEKTKVLTYKESEKETKKKETKNDDEKETKTKETKTKSKEETKETKTKKKKSRIRK